MRRFRRRFRKRVSRVQRYVELIPFSIKLGTSVSLTKSQLAGLPTRHNWKPHMIAIEAAPCFIPSTENDQHSYYAPSAANVQIFEGTACVAASRSVVISNSPRTIKVFYPRSQDWISYSQNDSYQFGIIESICLGGLGPDAGYLRGIARVVVQLQPEIMLSTCPTLLTNDSDDEFSLVN